MNGRRVRGDACLAAIVVGMVLLAFGPWWLGLALAGAGALILLTWGA